jgi:hypothetical protein
MQQLILCRMQNKINAQDFISDSCNNLMGSLFNRDDDGDKRDR